MDILDRDWKKEYPSTPEHFRSVVEQTVEAQMADDDKTVSKKRFSLRRLLIPVAACFVLVCGTAAGANSAKFRGWLEGLGNNVEEAEKLVTTEVEAEYKEDEPLLTIEDVYVDGSWLVFTAKLREGATERPCAMKDHAYINGVDCLSDDWEEIAEGEYQGKIIISDSLTGKDYTGQQIEVKVELYMNETETDSDISEFTFTIPGDTMNVTEQYEGDEIDLFKKDENGEEVCVGSVIVESTTAPSAVRMNLHFEFTGEDAEQNLKDIAYNGGYLVVDSAGNEMDLWQVMRDCGYSEPTEVHGTWSVDMMIDMDGFDYTSETITFIPYSWDCYEGGEMDGKRIEGTEVYHEEWAFTVPLHGEEE